MIFHLHEAVEADLRAAMADSIYHSSIMNGRLRNPRQRHRKPIEPITYSDMDSWYLLNYVFLGLLIALPVAIIWAVVV